MHGTTSRSNGTNEAEFADNYQEHQKGTDRGAAANHDTFVHIAHFVMDLRPDRKLIPVNICNDD